MSNKEGEASAGSGSDVAAADLWEANTHAFVLRIWQEEIPTQGDPIWRGHITHVISGQRRYFQRLSDVVGFITAYVAPMNRTMGRHSELQVSFLYRLHQWLCRWLHCSDGTQS